MEKRVVRLLSEDDIMLYDWEETRLNVRSYFSRYRSYTSKINMIKCRYNGSLSNDNLGIFSSNISNPTANKVEQYDKYNTYVSEINKHLDALIKELTVDEKIILKKSILDNYTDEEISEMISIARQHIYLRKKSCYIKVARYFDLEVEKNMY